MSTVSTDKTLLPGALRVQQMVQRKPCGRMCRVVGLRHNAAGEITHVQIRESHVRWKGWITAATFSRRWQEVGADTSKA